MRSTKMSSSIGWRGALRKPFLYYRVKLRRSNVMVDFSKREVFDNDTKKEIKLLSKD